MNVLLIHEHGRSFGSGGVIAMYRLHRALQQAGVNSTIACRRREIDGDDFVELPRSDRIESLLGSFTWRLGLNDIHCVSSFKIAKFKPFLDADVVNLHGLHTNFFSYLALPSLGRIKPLVATLHDMWHLTGHCSHSHECERWKTGCGRCPHLDTFPPISRDATAIDWKLKNWVYKRTPMQIVSPSLWLAHLAKQSMLQRYPIHHIPNGVDTTVFKPMEKDAAREMLGVPRDRLIVMFAAAAVNSTAKGSDLLVKALQSLPAALKPHITLVLLGDHGEQLTQAAGLPGVCLGYIRDDAQKVAVYSCADVFVLPSRAENHSLVLLEAMACGTPAVAFSVGGNPEIVRDGQTGYLAAPENHEQLRDAIVRVIEDRSWREAASDRCRQMIEQEFSLQQHTQRYIDLFRSVIAQRSGVQAAPAACS